MNNNVVFSPPRQARITDAKYSRFISGLDRIGLLRQEFRIVEENRDAFIGHEGDFRPNSTREQRTIRKDIVEFLSES